MSHQKLNTAKREKNDEFYTRFRDIETEVMIKTKKGKK